MELDNLAGFIEEIDYENEIKKPKINLKEIINSAALVLQIKKNKKEEDTIIRVSMSKKNAFNSRLSYLKRTNQDIDLFDLAGNSKKQLMVFPKGPKYDR